jgi:hypothetical protein
MLILLSIYLQFCLNCVHSQFEIVKTTASKRRRALLNTRSSDLQCPVVGLYSTNDILESGSTSAVKEQSLFPPS